MYDNPQALKMEIRRILKNSRNKIPEHLIFAYYKHRPDMTSSELRPFKKPRDPESLAINALQKGRINALIHKFSILTTDAGPNPAVVHNMQSFPKGVLRLPKLSPADKPQVNWAVNYSPAPLQGAYMGRKPPKGLTRNKALPVRHIAV